MHCHVTCVNWINSHMFVGFVSLVGKKTTNKTKNCTEA